MRSLTCALHHSGAEWPTNHEDCGQKLNFPIRHCSASEVKVMSQAGSTFHCFYWSSVVTKTKGGWGSVLTTAQCSQLWMLEWSLGEQDCNHSCSMTQVDTLYYFDQWNNWAGSWMGLWMNGWLSMWEVTLSQHCLTLLTLPPLASVAWENMNGL